MWLSLTIEKNKNVTLVLQYSCSMTCICVQSIEMTTIDHCVGSSLNFCDKLSSLDCLVDEIVYRPQRVKRFG